MPKKTKRVSRAGVPGRHSKRSPTAATVTAVRAFLRELATLSDAVIDDGDPALLGSFRDDARRLLRAMGWKR